MLSNVEKQYLNKTFQTIFSAKRTCVIDGCNQKTSANHVFSESLLKKMNTASVYHLDLNHFSDLSHPVSFTESGTDRIRLKAVSMSMLCNSHDNIFKPIEGNNPNYNLKENNMLLAYKAILHEIDKHEKWLIFFEKTMRDKNFGYLYLTQGMAIREKKYQDIIKYLWSEKEYLDSQIFKGGDSDPLQKLNFEYEVHYIQKIDFYMCSFSDFVPSYFSDFMNLYAKYERQRNIFLHVIPESDRTVVCIQGFGCSGINSMGRSLESFFVHYEKMNKGIKFKNEEEKLLKFISDHALSRSDTWCFTPNFFLSNVKDRKKEFLDIKNAYGSSVKRDQPLGDVCLFW